MIKPSKTTQARLTPAFAVGKPAEPAEREYFLRDFFCRHFPEYCKTHPISDDKRRIMNSIMACRTGKLGYSLITCEECGSVEYYPCSCGSRYCPSCGTLKQMKWIARQQECLIPGIPYFHMVFTIPHELNPLICHNQTELLNILFSSVKETLLTLAMKKLHMVPGILMVLHSFGSNLSLHYHLHVLVSGGGLTADRTEFKKCLSNKFFLPLKAVTRTYRGKFMDSLKHARLRGKLLYFNDTEKYRNTYEWHQLLNTCYSQEWNVEIKRFLGPDTARGAVSFAPYVSRKMIDDRRVLIRRNNALSSEHRDPSASEAIQYFSNYTHCSAINDSRITAVSEDEISFIYKQYHDQVYEKKIMTLKADEFIRRYLMHILPKGFQKIRSAGFLSGCIREKSLQLIHKLLSLEYTPSIVKNMKSTELIRYFFKEDVLKCTHCRQKHLSSPP